MHYLRKLLPGDYFPLFRKPAFVYFSWSVLLSQIAFQMMNVSLIFLVYHLTDSNLAVSLLVLSFIVPQIIFSFFGGIVADVRSKKKILIWGNILRAVIILTLVFDTNSLYLIFLVSIFVSIITQFYVPAEPPYIPQIVSKTKLVAANSIFGMSLFGSILIAFVLSGPLIQLVGRSSVFLVIALLFSISAFLVVFLPNKKKRGPDVEGSFLYNLIRYFHEEFLESTRLLRNKYNVGASFFLLTFSQVVILVLASVIPDYATKVLFVRAEDLSMILFAPAAVGMIGASVLFGGRLGQSSGRNVATIGVFLSGIALVLFPLAPQLSRIFFSINPIYFSGVFAFLAGFGNAFIFVPSQSTIQHSIPENFRSKVYGLLFAVVGMVSLFPILVAGSIADIFGVGLVLSTVGFLILLVGIFRLRFYFSI